MRLHDYTIAHGAVHAHRLQETTALAPTAVAITDRMLRELRAGAPRVSHGVRELPRCDVGLGLGPVMAGLARIDPNVAARSVAPDRWFWIAMPLTSVPFSLNLVLPADSDAESDRYALATLLGLSRGASEHAGATSPYEPSAAPAVLEQLWSHRPLIATTFWPGWVDAETVSVAADLSTCFAASMLRIDSEA